MVTRRLASDLVSKTEEQRRVNPEHPKITYAARISFACSIG
jgi:hypothetical protein